MFRQEQIILQMRQSAIQLFKIMIPFFNKSGHLLQLSGPNSGLHINCLQVKPK